MLKNLTIEDDNIIIDNNLIFSIDYLDNKNLKNEKKIEIINITIKIKK